MARTFESTINSFYLAYYGRPADPAGLAFWSMQLDAAHGDFGAIAGAFAGSEEAQVRFGSSDATARITQIYQQLYNRAPDAEGLAFWTKAIASGAMTMADAAIQILHGAQGSDATLATARQAAAEAFTAEVAKSGVAYDGYAAIEAARVLVKAVGTTTSATDVDAMVKATAKLVAIAHGNPKVVDAIAVGTTLEKLFDTARGHAEPAKLVQALADVAAAAAGDPATLESLLRGGGMAKVLEVMPAGATLGDVVDALAKGGLPAAIEVVYPTPPAAPVVPLTLKFVKVSEDAHDPVPNDNVTNVDSADVTFSYSRALKSSQHVEWTTDGGATWHTDGFDVVAKGRTIVIHGVDLTGIGLPPPPPPRLDPEAGNREPVPQNVTTTVQVRVVEGGKVVASASQDIVHDGFVPAPVVEFDTSKTHLDMVEQGIVLTNNASFTVTDFEQGAKLSYLVTDNNANVSTWTGVKPTLKEGVNTFSVRAVDAAGNTAISDVVVKLDTVAPSTFVKVALDADTGASATDMVTNAGKIDLTQLDTHTDTAWEYSLDQGAHWTFGAINDGTGTDTLELDAPQDGAYKVWVRQYDAAGNIAGTVSSLDFTLDTKAPDATFFFASVSGNDDSTKPASTKSTLADVVFNYKGTVEAGEIVQWRTGSGDWKTVGAGDIGQGTVTIHDLDLSTSDPTVQIKAVDLAGNVTQTVSQKIDGPYEVKPLTVSLVANGPEIKKGIEGTVFINDGQKNTNLAVSSGENAIAGGVGVGAQSAIRDGIIAIKGTDNAQFPDPALRFYRLGTDGDDNLGNFYSWGFGGNDNLKGDAKSADQLYGGDGNDTISGFGGWDVLNGGAGYDTFVFGAGHSSYNPATKAGAFATITDFGGPDGDLIKFNDTGWGTLTKAYVSTTLYTGLDAMLAQAKLTLGDANAGVKLFAGQLGADTYVFARDVSTSGDYVEGVDTMVKLAKFSSYDLQYYHFMKVTEVVRGGDDSVFYDGTGTGNWGAAPVYLHGEDDGVDHLLGGTGDDVLVGGKGGDIIELSGGVDTLVYDSAEDSHLSTGAGAVSFDTVSIAVHADVEQVRFVFGGDLLGVRKVDADLTSGDLLANIDKAYREAATSRYDAVLIDSADASYLVLNNGDNVIDANDYVIKIVGHGAIALDNGQVVFTFDQP